MTFFFPNGRSRSDGGKITSPFYLLCILFTNTAAYLGCHCMAPAVSMMQLSHTSSPSTALVAHGFSRPLLVSHMALKKAGFIEPGNTPSWWDPQGSSVPPRSRAEPQPDPHRSGETPYPHGQVVTAAAKQGLVHVPTPVPAPQPGSAAGDKGSKAH